MATLIKIKMKKFCLSIICLLVVVCLPAIGKPVLNIQHWVTANGAQVLFVPTHELPMLDIQITFNASSARDGNNPGLAQFTNAMLNEGTKTLTADQIAESFDNVGAQFNAGLANQDMAVVSLRSLTNPKLLNPALKTFTAIITEPTFPQPAFMRVQKQILSAIKQKHQQPLSIAVDNFYRALYGDLPYGHPILGTTKSIQTLTSKDLQSFYQQYYVAKNAVVAIVGDVTLPQAKAIVNQIVAPLPSGQAAAPLPPAPTLTATKKIHINFPSEQTSVWMGQVAINWHDPDFFPLVVGNFILGESPLTSNLFQEVRNKRGLAYSVKSGFALLQQPGPFFIFLQTRNNQAQQAIKVALNTLQNFVTKGPSAKQLQAAKQSIIGRFPLQLASNSQILTFLTNIAFYHLPLDYLDTYRANIKAVTLKQIQTAFKHHIQPDKMVIVTLGYSTYHH